MPAVTPWSPELQSLPPPQYRACTVWHVWVIWHVVSRMLGLEVNVFGIEGHATNPMSLPHNGLQCLLSYLFHCLGSMFCLGLMLVVPLPCLVGVWLPHNWHWLACSSMPWAQVFFFQKKWFAQAKGYHLGRHSWATGLPVPASCCCSQGVSLEAMPATPVPALPAMPWSFACCFSQPAMPGCFSACLGLPGAKCPVGWLFRHVQYAEVTCPITAAFTPFSIGNKCPRHFLFPLVHGTGSFQFSTVWTNLRRYVHAISHRSRVIWGCSLLIWVSCLSHGMSYMFIRSLTLNH